VTLVKQEKVACLVDNDATLALDPADSFAVQTKPHGHGDVHALLHSSGLASKWHRSGLKWVAFFQVCGPLRGGGWKKGHLQLSSRVLVSFTLS
jgi:UDP-N-acetylglucosamine pyrophosphorylase